MDDITKEMIDAEAVDIIFFSSYVYFYLKFSVKQIIMYTQKTLFGIGSRFLRKQRRKWMNFKKSCEKKNKITSI